MREALIHMSARPRVLVIGGSDSSGGAGITRDVGTLADWQVEAAVAITAVTAQTDCKVNTIHHVPQQVIAEQISSAVHAHSIAAIKIGMLGCRASLQAVLATLPASGCPVVLDPVMLASSGAALLDEDAVALLCQELLPRVMVLTPNMAEAASLLRRSIANDAAAMQTQALELLELGPQAVLLKGGHASGAEAVDVLVSRTGAVEKLALPRISATLRGTGCMLASVLAARLAVRVPLLQACADAKRYVNERLQAARSQE
jgi:hydroxymethylpyrimidine/phosphomethylpyrimidine kinase